MPLVKIFCEVDDFCKDFFKQFQSNLLTNDDKGYILSPFNFKSIYDKGVHVVTKIRKNMKK